MADEMLIAQEPWLPQYRAAIAEAKRRWAAGPQIPSLPGVFDLSAALPRRSEPSEIRRIAVRLEESVQSYHVSKTGNGRTQHDLRPKATAIRLEPAPQPKPVAGTTALLSHRFSETQEGFQAVFGTDRTPGTQRVFFMRNPARWVVDVEGVWRNASPKITVPPGLFINRVVIGVHETYLRVVFHYADAAAAPLSAPRLTKETSEFSVVIPRLQ
jgi:hypothetical protein